MKNKSYRKLILMNVAMFIAMFAIMYVMVDNVSHVYININQFFMVTLMVTVMILLTFIFMSSMYMDKRKNKITVGASILVMIVTFFFIRTQGLTDNRQFLKSMIPHHSSAILMCQEANIEDPEIKFLCEGIIEAQQREILQMQSILERLGN